MKNKWIGILVLVLLAGLVGWGVYWFLSNYERQYREVRVGVSPEARRNRPNQWYSLPRSRLSGRLRPPRYREHRPRGRW